MNYLNPKRILKRHFWRLVDDDRPLVHWLAVAERLVPSALVTLLAAYFGLKVSTAVEVAPLGETFIKITTAVCGVATALFLDLLGKVYGQLQTAKPQDDQRQRKLLSLLTDNLVFALSLSIFTFFTSLTFYVEITPKVTAALPYLTLFLVCLLADTIILCFQRMTILIQRENHRVFPEQLED